MCAFVELFSGQMETEAGTKQTGDLAWTCHQCMEARVWVKSPGEPIKGEEKRSQDQVQRKSNHPGEEDKG